MKHVLIMMLLVSVGCQKETSLEVTAKDKTASPGLATLPNISPAGSAEVQNTEETSTPIVSEEDYSFEMVTSAPDSETVTLSITSTGNSVDRISFHVDRADFLDCASPNYTTREFSTSIDIKLNLEDIAPGGGEVGVCVIGAAFTNGLVLIWEKKSNAQQLVWNYTAKPVATLPIETPTTQTPTTSSTPPPSKTKTADNSPPVTDSKTEGDETETTVSTKSAPTKTATIKSNFTFSTITTCDELNDVSGQCKEGGVE